MAQGVPGRLCGSRGTPALRYRSAAVGRGAEFHGFRTRSTDLSWNTIALFRSRTDPPKLTCVVAGQSQYRAKYGTVMKEERKKTKEES